MPRRRRGCSGEGLAGDLETAGVAFDQSGRARGSDFEETLSYYSFPEERWWRVRTNNPLEIRWRTRVVGGDSGDPPNSHPLQVSFLRASTCPQVRDVCFFERSPS
jgi:hypothetical protein